MSDPLSGLTLGLRIQTHNGDGVPLGQYLDAACSSPALAVDSIVKGLKDELSGLGVQGTQATSAKAATLQFTGGGVPFLNFDGVDDWYVAFVGASIGGQKTYSMLIKSNTSNWNGYWSPIDSSVGGGGRWGLVSGVGNQNWHNDPYPSGVNKEGVDLSAPFDCAPINDWFTYTVTTNNAASGARGIGQLEQSFYGNFGLIALIFHEPADTATVRTYLDDLKVAATPPTPSGNAILGGGFF